MAEPDLVIPTVNIVIMLASLIPMSLVDRAAHRMDRRGVTTWLLVTSGVGLVMVTLRVFDFGALNVRWDSSAYGSIAWAIVGLHTLLLVMELGETIGGTALMLTADVDTKHFVDAADNASYWTFTVLGWVPLYVVVYLLPRWT
jgi:heme/copper-type cytochrome/quinol oxidase subunit 3